jgi:SAM-dependent methyltransferase
MSELVKQVAAKNRQIPSYQGSANIDGETVTSFGEEWNAFHGFSEKDIISLGDKYFDIVPQSMLNENSTVIDIGCGSGRFIKYFQTKYKYKSITGVDPSAAILAADALVGPDERVNLIQAAADKIPFPDNHFDFAYSLGVLHHIPDTAQALNDSVKKVKPGGHFLLYLYYSLDNRSAFFRFIFHCSNLLRRGVAALPGGLKRFVCNVLAVLLYMPFVLLCRFLKVIGVPEKIRRKVPLQGYEDQSFYVIRNDSLDRFGTPLEHRFSRKQITAMMEAAGLTDIVFSEEIPFWHSIGRKK